MTGAELKAIRKGLLDPETGKPYTLSSFAKAIGYKGNKNSRSVDIRRFESEKRKIPHWTIRRINALVQANLVEPNNG
jgi:hypothetical protein